MNIILITQDDTFFLPDNIDYLIRGFPDDSRIVAAVLLDASPFGGKKGFITKAKETYAIFGTGFFIRYAYKFCINKIILRRSVRTTLNRHAIKILEISDINSDSSLNLINSYKPDLLISIAGNQIFKKPLIQLANKGLLNLHTALLPKYRGLMPSFWVLKNKEEYTGVSVFFVDEGIDSGPILVQKKISIGNKTQSDLIKETKKLGMDAIIEAVKLIGSGIYELIDNDDAKMTYYSFPTKKDVNEFRKAGKRFY